VALFGKTSKDKQADSAGAPAKDKNAIVPNEAKAAKFFEHAKSIQDTANYEYAMTLWLQGMRQDPTSMNGLESFCGACLLYRSANPKAKGPTKDQAKEFGGKPALERYLNAVLNWGAKGFDWTAGMKAMEIGAKLGLDEPAYFIGARVLALMQNDQKAKKDHYVQLMRLFDTCGGHDKATLAGERAIQLDPSDGKLEAQVKNMSAMATMARSGFDSTGEPGGFRKNIKNSDVQRELEEEERIVKTEGVMERVIAKAMADYESRTDDMHAIQKYAKLLMERGTPEDEARAYKVLVKGFQDTQTYRFKQAAGDIKMRVGRRKLAQVKKAMEQSPGDTALAQKYEKSRRQILELEITEYTERVAALPTDVQLKFELGRRQFEIEDYENAIEQFQQAQGAPGIAVKVLRYLGDSFTHMGWLDEAIESFRTGIEKIESDTSDVGLQLRYGLMNTLDRKAREQRDLPSAEEAFKVASGIAVQQINYSDIRDRRASIQEFIKELKAAG